VAMDLGVPEARGALSRLLLRWAPPSGFFVISPKKIWCRGDIAAPIKHSLQLI
jgi:hypothetical protein